MNSCSKNPVAYEWPKRSRGGGGEAVRMEIQDVQRGRKRPENWSPIATGCLILLLAGCAPAVMMTVSYVDNKDEPRDSIQFYSVSGNQAPLDQTPLLTTKNYRHVTGQTPGSTRVYRAGLDQVWNAALKALGALNASVTSRTRDQTGGEIQGWWVGGQPLTMRLDRAGTDSIRVTIQVGQFGNEEAQNAISTKINENL